jgi:hypothetical protein
MKHWISWQAIVEKTVEIEADTVEQAFKKWQQGDYEADSVEIDDEDVFGESIEIDNEEYYAHKFERVYRGAGNGE